MLVDVLAEFLRKGPPFSSAGYDDLEASHILARTDHYRITPSPGGLGDRYGKNCYETSNKSVIGVVNTN